MKEKFSEKEKESALFKGIYIDKFLRIEHFTEQIIISFFKEQYPSSIWMGGLNNIDKLRIDIKNRHLEFFFEYFLYPHPFFSTEHKMNFLETIMQLTNGDFYNKISVGKYSVFSLLKLLKNLRNIIAHNFIVHTEDNKMLAVKYANKFQGEHKHEIDKEGKKVGKTNFRFYPVINSYHLTENIKDDIFMQLECVKFFLEAYLFKVYGVSVRERTEEAKKKEEEDTSLALYEFATSPKIYGNIGVFKLFEKVENPKEPTPKKKKPTAGQ